jgi:hypothetical protein
MAWLMAPLSEAERATLVRLLAKVQQQAVKHPADVTTAATV